MRARTAVGFGALACAACCAGPVLAALGTIAALGAVSTLFMGLAGLVVAAVAITAGTIIWRRQRGRTCATTAASVPVAAPTGPSSRSA